MREHLTTALDMQIHEWGGGLFLSEHSRFVIEIGTDK